MSETKKAPKKTHKFYGVVAVATGEGFKALFETLGADIVINGGQTGNPATEEFLEAFESLNADHILVFPNNSNILLTARQAAELWKKGNVTVIPTKNFPQGYAALSVFNSSLEDIDAQVADILAAKDGVRSGELTMAIRDTTVGGIDIKCGEYIGILDGKIVTSLTDPIEAFCDMIGKIDDIDERELITLFVGADVSEEDRVNMTEAIEERFEDLELQVYVGGQEIYDYLVSVE
jgi:dihydroxyacetone kinase-like predicted kinase